MLSLLVVLLAAFAFSCAPPPAVHILSSEPVISGGGPLDSNTIDAYQVLAVFDFQDAPGAPKSGAILAELVTSELLNIGFTVVERLRLRQLFEEQRLELRQADEKTVTLKVGKLMGAKAIVTGTIHRWPTEGQRQDDLDVSAIAFSLKMIDVQTGLILFGRHAYYSRPAYVNATPERLALTLLRTLITQLMIATDLKGTGLAGFGWTLTERANRRVAVVTEVEHGSPAEQMGLKVGDELLACNDSPAASWQTLWDSFRACRVEAGQILALWVTRQEDPSLIIKIRAVDRLEWVKNAALIPL